MPSDDTIRDAALYSALTSRDARFDGVFFVGVTSTGIYCRPVCTARTPKAANCRFFTTASAAEKARFRPCLRCRPELAPGCAPVDDARRIATRIATLLATRVEEGLPDGAAGLETIAKQFGYSSRQIRRIVQHELGVSPIELVLTHRLLLAKQLLTETALPISDVAYASGFASLRRFNDAFSKCYGMPPTRLRKSTGSTRDAAPTDTLTLQLAYRVPFDWAGILRFLGMRSLKEVEYVAEHSYSRTVRIGDYRGWVRVRNAQHRRAVLVELSHSLTPALPSLLARLRELFDLSARPDVISTQLMRDDALATSVAHNPGLRVPGAFDGFELALRAILGQQISVKAATTVAGRFADTFGEPISTPYAELTRLSPTARRIAHANVDDVASLGVIRTRAQAIITLAREIDSGRLTLDAGMHPEATIRQLVALPGIGEWTAHYIAMRALRWPDAFPKEDAVLRKKLGGVSAARAEELSQSWGRSWRSYATLHLWHA